MTLHFRPLPKAHDKALKALKADTTRRLRAEIAIERAQRSRPKHERESQHFRQCGELA